MKRFSLIGCVGLATLLLAGAGRADVQLNVTTNLDQRHVAVATMPASSNAVFVWEDASVTNSDLYMRIYQAASGTFTTQQQVTVYTNGQQLFPSVAAMSNGFIVAFQTKGFYTNSYAIGVRRFLTNGLPLDAQEFRGNVQATYSALRPAVGVMTNGGFWLAYEMFNGTDQDLYVRRYNPDGSPVDISDVLLLSAAGDQGAPVIARLKDGRFVLAYEDRETASIGVVLLNAAVTSGALPGAGFLTNAWTYSSPAVAPLTDGGFVVVCDAETNNTAAGRVVMAQIYDSNAIPRLAVTLGSHTQRWERPRVAQMPAGGFAAVWQTPGSPGDATNAFAVFSARFTSNGVAASWPHTIPAVNTNDQDSAAIATQADGSQFIAWQSFGQDTTNSYGIFETGVSKLSTQRVALAIGTAGATGTVTVAGAGYEIYTIETSTNLQSWAFLATTNSPTGIAVYLDQARTNKLRHFRAWGYP